MIGIFRTCCCLDYGHAGRSYDVGKSNSELFQRLKDELIHLEIVHKNAYTGNDGMYDDVWLNDGVKNLHFVDMVYPYGVSFLDIIFEIYTIASVVLVMVLSITAVFAFKGQEADAYDFVLTFSNPPCKYYDVANNNVSSVHITDCLNVDPQRLVNSNSSCLLIIADINALASQRNGFLGANTGLFYNGYFCRFFLFVMNVYMAVFWLRRTCWVTVRLFRPIENINEENYKEYYSWEKEQNCRYIFWIFNHISHYLTLIFSIAMLMGFRDVKSFFSTAVVSSCPAFVSNMSDILHSLLINTIVIFVTAPINLFVDCYLPLVYRCFRSYYKYLQFGYWFNCQFGYWFNCRQSQKILVDAC